MFAFNNKFFIFVAWYLSSVETSSGKRGFPVGFSLFIKSKNELPSGAKKNGVTKVSKNKVNFKKTLKKF